MCGGCPTHPAACKQPRLASEQARRQCLQQQRAKWRANLQRMVQRPKNAGKPPPAKRLTGRLPPPPLPPSAPLAAPAGAAGFAWLLCALPARHAAAGRLPPPASKLPTGPEPQLSSECCQERRPATAQTAPRRRTAAAAVVLAQRGEEPRAAGALSVLRGAARRCAVRTPASRAVACCYGACYCRGWGGALSVHRQTSPHASCSRSWRSGRIEWRARRPTGSAADDRGRGRRLGRGSTSRLACGSRCGCAHVQGGRLDRAKPIEPVNTWVIVPTNRPARVCIVPTNPPALL